MKTWLHFDSTGGAAGDMILGALLGLGVPTRDVEKTLGSLVTESFTLTQQPHHTGGLQGVQCSIHVPEEPHAHRNLKEITALIEKSALPDEAQHLSLKVFTRLAAAEAGVHGTTPDQIHFHEVGALDSLLDICGSCLALHQLDVSGISCGPLPLGCGLIPCAHGNLPAPAPATLRLLEGMPTVQTDEPFELITPTGAALLSTWKTAAAPPPGSAPLRSVFSFGHRTLKQRPNLLRATLYAVPEPSAPSQETCVLLETNLDDQTPELIGLLLEKLRPLALEVFSTPVQMKKNRPGLLVSVLCAEAQKPTCLETLFRESSTFGIREQTVQRHLLERNFKKVETPWGPVRIKHGFRNGTLLTRSPEIGDCEQCATAHGVPVKTVYQAALKGMP